LSDFLSHVQVLRRGEDCEIFFLSDKIKKYKFCKKYFITKASAMGSKFRDNIPLFGIGNSRKVMDHLGLIAGMIDERNHF
jgi:hypothetical protein